MIDALAVHKDAEGDIEVQHLSNLSKDETIEIGSKVGALIGLGIEGEEGMEAGAGRRAEAGADGISAFTNSRCLHRWLSSVARQAIADGDGDR